MKPTSYLANEPTGNINLHAMFNKEFWNSDKG